MKPGVASSLILELEAENRRLTELVGDLRSEIEILKNQMREMSEGGTR